MTLAYFCSIPQDMLYQFGDDGKCEQRMQKPYDVPLEEIKLCGPTGNSYILSWNKWGFDFPGIPIYFLMDQVVFYAVQINDDGTQEVIDVQCHWLSLIVYLNSAKQSKLP